MKLRPYQLEAVAATYDHLSKKETNPCVVIPTAGGKSLVLGQIAADVVSRWNGRVLILAHVKELLQQNAEKVRAICPDIEVGIYSAGLNSRDTDTPVLVAGIQSVYQRAQELGTFDLVIVDEAHLIPEDGDGMYRTFLAASKELCPHQRVVGFTATPYRVQGGLICKPENVLNEVCYEVGVRRLIAEGYISKLTAKAGHSTIDLTGLHVRAGEFVAEDVDKAVGNKSAVDSSVADMIERAKGRKSIIVFCSSVAHCSSVADRIRELTGDRVAVVTGETPSHERAKIIQEFKGVTQTDLFGNTEPSIRWLCNMGVLTTGFDAPNIDCVALLRPTKSAGLYVQMVGRGFRLSPETGKQDCLVLDYGGNIARHGPVDAVTVKENRGTGLKDKETPMAKECPNCAEMVHPAVMVCPACGFEFPKPTSELDDRARNGGILSGEVSFDDHQIRRADYDVHVKRNAEPGAPRTVECDYFDADDFRVIHREWLCPEHTGYARQKFERWWHEHARRDIYPPFSAEEVAALCRNPAIVRQPSAITVKTVAGEKYPRVVGYALKDFADPMPNPAEPPEPGSDIGVAFEPSSQDVFDDDDNLPF